MKHIFGLLFLPFVISIGAGGEPPLKNNPPISRIAFGSCAHQDRPQPIWKAILKENPELFVFLGDNIYADTPLKEVMRAKYAKLNSLAEFSQFRSKVPLVGTWDDHDYGQNDAGVEFAPKDDAQTELLDFLGVAKDSPRRMRKGVYEAWTFGKGETCIQVILLDTRYHRSPIKKGPRIPNKGNYLPNTDPDATVLGNEQWEWLENKLKEPAALRIIGSSIQVVSEDHGWEKWMNFPLERERLYKLVRDTKANGVVFLSGDRHLGEISVMDADWGYPVVDITSSGLNQANTNWRRQEPNRYRFAAMPWEHNYGLVEVDWNAKNGPLVSLSLKNEEGRTAATYRVPLKNLQFKVPAKDAPVGPGAIGPREASKKMGERLTVEFEIASTGQSRDKGRIFLNSMGDYRDPANFTIVIQAQAFEESWKTVGLETYRKELVGKKIRATGVISEFQGKAQMEIDDPKLVLINK